jgi:hypothetical protein
MIAECRFSPLEHTPSWSRDASQDRAAIGRGTRSIQIALALYLLPVLVVVLALGSLGMVALGLGRLLGHSGTKAYGWHE